MATSQEVGGWIDQSYDELTNYQSKKKNPTELYNDAVSSLGIPEVRTRVANLRRSLVDTENLLSGVEGSVKGRTQGSLVTEAQRQRLTAIEREPIAGQLGKMQSAYGVETGNLGDLMGEANSKTQLAIQGQTQGEESIRTKLEKYKEMWARLKKDEDAKAEAAREAARLAVERSSRSSSSSSKSGGKETKGTAMSIGDSIKDLVMNQKLTWGRAAKLIESKNGKIATDSDTDVYLKFYFGLREGNPGKYLNKKNLQRAYKLGLTRG